MSFQAMSWAVEKKLPTNQKMVLMMLANRTNHETGRCDPSHKRLAFDCGMSISTLKRCIKSLEESGLLEIVTRKSGDVNLPNQYILNLGVVDSERTDLVHSEPRVGSDRPEGVGSQRPTKQELYNQEDKQRSIVTQSATVSEINPNSASIKSIIDYLNGFTKVKSQAKGQNSKTINARLNEGFTEADLKLVVDYKAREWGRDAHWCQYLRPSTLFQPNKFPGYLSAARLERDGESIRSGSNWTPDDESTDWANNLNVSP
jgi:uncharacterized phage protein (TIGR02220 family)